MKKDVDVNQDGHPVDFARLAKLLGVSKSTVDYLRQVEDTPFHVLESDPETGEEVLEERRHKLSISDFVGKYPIDIVLLANEVIRYREDFEKTAVILQRTAEILDLYEISQKQVEKLSIMSGVHIAMVDECVRLFSKVLLNPEILRISANEDSTAAARDDAA